MNVSKNFKSHKIPTFLKIFLGYNPLPLNNSIYKIPIYLDGLKFMIATIMIEIVENLTIFY